MEQRPDPAAASTAADFACQLRLLKVWAGDPSLRDLSRMTGQPRSTISDALNPDRSRFPALDLVRILVQAFGGGEDLPRWEQAWRDIKASRDGRLRVADLMPNACLRVPAELPPNVATFVGRNTALAALDSQLHSAHHGRTVVIAMVSGTAGVGKTALALRWAHSVRDRFPDGQLYANLRGYDPGEPAQASEILAAFLRSLGVPAAEIPRGVDERAARYRTLLADRRVLVMLDNASHAEQVRPLLPGSSQSLVLVTSRDSLSGLSARDGAYRVQLRLMPLPEAMTLLRALVGDDRMDADPAAATALAEQCACLPLALRIAAEHAASRPGEPLAKLVAELEREGLDLLDTHSDDHSAMRIVFSWSYRRLPAPAACVFRLLGLHPSRHASRHSVAAAADITPDEASDLLYGLVRANLVEETNDGRYGMHELLRAYAAELATAEPRAAQRAALTRLFDHYLHSTAAAKDAMHPWDKPPKRSLPGDARHALSFAGPEDAARWLSLELSNLVAVGAHTADGGWPEHTAGLSALLWRYLNLGSHHDEALAIHGHALCAARHHGHIAAAARAEFRIGDVWWRVGRYEDSTAHFEQALILRRQAGDRIGEAHILGGLATVDSLTGRHEQALEHYAQALAIAREVGSRDTEAIQLANVGTVYMQLGRNLDSVEQYEQALAIQREIDAKDDAAWTLINLGLALIRLGRLDEAIDDLQQALALARELSGQAIEAAALNRLATAASLLGRVGEAAGYHRQALDICQKIDDRAGVGEALHGLGVVHHKLGQRAVALHHFQQALIVRRALNDPNGQAETLNALGDVLSDRRHHEAALALARQVGNRYEQALALSGLGEQRQARELFAAMGIG